ncbi:hypothetical protein ABIE45_003853 [Methylobacterium sp. OAE515]|uniref:hypothetical protein n=1 Tax=Methylobacterium sp. OAE515 TaxID=2817895 RepID=UPI00178A1CBF
MSANPDRRRLLGLIAATPLAAAAGAPPTAARAGLLRRLSPGFAGGFSRERLAGLGRFADELDRTEFVLDTAPSGRLAAAAARLTELDTGFGADPAVVLAQQAAEARAIAALALVYPPEIAAYRSFGAPMRRRLYAELLTRESARLAAASEPPPMPSAPPGPDA